MTRNEALWQQAADLIRAAERCLVVCHVRPDGDAIGSLLGLGLALQAAGKQVTMVSPDGVPHAHRHLRGSEQVVTQARGAFDLVVVVDSSDLARLGEALLGVERQPDLNIDHHVTNEAFARLNLVDTSAAATAEMIALALPRWNLPCTPQVAAALLSGIVTDTIGFRTPNVTATTLRVAADLMDHGAELAELYRLALVNRPLAAIRLWAAGLGRLEQEERLVWTTLTLADRRAAQYPGRDDADLINLLSAIEGADIAVIFVEQPNGTVKVSWRAQPGYDVSQIATLLGGGGHPSASGAELAGSLEEVQARVLTLTRSLLNGGHRVQP